VNSRRQVSAALLGLLALVVAVWFGQGAWSVEQHSREQNHSAQRRNFAVDPDR